MYLVKRLAFAIPLILLISFLAFCLVRLAPGGPFDRERASASPAVELALQKKYRLDEPLWHQYASYLKDLLRGDLGPSMKYRDHSVNEIIAQGLPVSLMIGGLAFGLALSLGIPLGIFTAVRHGGWGEFTGSVVALVAICIPAFIVGPILILIFGIRLQWLPVALLESPLHFILPTTTLGIYFAGRVARLMSEGMKTVLQAEFIKAARAKGLGEFAILTRHALPLAILPVVSFSGPLLADLFTGSFVVENLFHLPGIGVFLVNSSLNRDYTLLVGLVIVYAALLIFLNLAVDLVYRFLDPRVRYD